ncbi:major capsid protein [Rosettibacter firmus]|uniref:major capsid protein n=1 Tax=Rosettibacter firmus TaxID=3111522 RepID=UPI00336BE45E
MKLQQISAQDTLTQQVVTQMISRATVLEFAEFYSIIGNADYTRKAAAASGGQFRALDSDYPDNKISPAFANPILKILGDKVQVDRAHERRGLDIASVRARELMNFAQSLGKQFQKYFFNGQASATEFDGLKNIVPTSQKIVAATNGLSIPLGNDNTAKTSQQKFLELVNKLIRKIDGGAQVLFMNGDTLSRLTTIAREFIQWQVNQFGQLIPYFNGIPIRDAGYDKDGNLIIGFDETVGTSTDCTSIYAVRFGEGADLSIATNVGVEVKDLGLVGVHYTHSVEFDADIVLLNDKSVAKLEGIRLA